MPIYEFAMNSTGTSRVQIFQESSNSGATVLVNRGIIGTIASHDELLVGREFTLKDGATLTVRLVNYAFQVMREGQPLQLMSVDAIAVANAIAAKESSLAAAATMTAMAKKAAEEKATAIPLSLKESNSLTFTSRKSMGWIIAGIGALLALFAFFSMPYITLGIFSVTGQQIASTGSQYGGQFGGLQILWLEPLVAVILLIIAGVQLFRSASQGYDTLGGGLGLIGLASFTLLILLGKYFLLDTQPTVIGTNLLGTTLTAPALASFYGSGFWVYIVGIIIVIVGGVVAARSA